MSIKFNFNSFKTVDKKESTRKGNGSEHTSIHNNEKTIIHDVDGKIKTVVFKQGELLETHNDNDNQQPSISSNAFKGSTTNSRVQTDNAEDSNADTSALPSINTSDDIV